jgi:hypothetical protein
MAALDSTLSTKPATGLLPARRDGLRGLIKALAGKRVGIRLTGVLVGNRLFLNTLRH